MMGIVSTRYGKMRIIDADNGISRALALYGEWAMDELSLLAKIIAPGMTVLDAGAFIGTHTLSFSEFVGHTGKVYSFEPRKEIYAILSENLAINDCQNVTALNMGLAEKEQTLNLQSLNINQAINFGGLALEANDGSLSSNTYQVRVSTIDSLGIEKIDVIKLDVEGMERRVLDGAIETVLRDRPIVFCECNSLNAGSEVLEFCQATQYDTYGFLASAYNPHNFNAIKENIFGAAKELALVLIPHEEIAETLSKITDVNLLPINNLEDLVLPLLYKPQYPYEVLAHTAPCSLLGIDFPSPALGVRDGQITGLNQAVQTLTETVAQRDAVVTERDVQIANLNQAVAEREGQLAGLNHAMADRDRQIISLNQVVQTLNETVAQRDAVVAERDGQISNFQRRESELQLLSNELRNEIVALRLSTSWQITKPLREVSRWGRRFMRPIRLYQNYRQRYTGINGFWRLVNRCIDAIRKGGIKELRSSVAMHERSRSTALPLPSGSVLLLDDIPDATFKLPKDVAVHAHIYYHDLAVEIRSYLENIPVKFHFYVTTDTLEKAKLIEDAFSNMENIFVLDIRITENRGRDIFPMLVMLGAELAEHEIVLHIHTKRSPHNSWILGGWRRYMMESLLGNPQRVTAILQQFVQNENLGILFPDPYHPIKPFIHRFRNANDHSMKNLLSLAGKKEAELRDIDRTFFPGGDMFWFRGKAIKPFVNMRLSAHDFEPEEGQVDETLAHAIERMFPYFAGEMGLVTKSYFANSFLSQQCSAHQIFLLHTYIERGLILNPNIIFDHNAGGGANTYTQELAKIILADGGSVLRVYCFEAIWFVQWIVDGDGMLFYTQSIDELFKALFHSKGTNLIVNSLYGCPDIKEVIAKILVLVQELKIPLEIKLHDFNALCPSPHLADFEGNYCGVPQDFEVCTRCLKKNHDWYHSWYPEENRPIDIAEWRKPFAELFEAATIVTFFDPSSIEIVRKAFYLDSSKLKVIPHTINYFKCDNQMDLSGLLHIGILGILNIIKGGKIVYALSDYIYNRGLKIPITVVGPDNVGAHEHLRVHGPYEQNDLPVIVREQGINVILMPSIIPETFSYTISEAMKMGLPIVAFDIGAQGNRVKQYKLGKVVPLGSSPDVILKAIQSVLKTAQEFKK